jgi:hypothetical protein
MKTLDPGRVGNASCRICGMVPACTPHGRVFDHDKCKLNVRFFVEGNSMGDRQFEPLPKWPKYVRLYIWFFAVSTANISIFTVFPEAFENYFPTSINLFPPFS